MKLEVGAGESPREGYEHMDCRALPHIEHVTDEPWWTSFEDNSLEAIYSRHFFEHLDRFQAHATLDEWHRILQPEGSLHIITPNLGYHAKQLSEPGMSPFFPAKWTNREHAINSIYGWGISWEQHLYGWTRNTLREALEQAGFRQFWWLDDRACDLDVECKKCA